MSDRRSAFESGFFAEPDANMQRTGEYKLGDIAAQSLSGQLQPPLEEPDELTVRRRMAALKAPASDTPGADKKRPILSWAFAASVFLAVGLGLLQWQNLRDGCGTINGHIAVIHCGQDHDQIAAVVAERFPGDALYAEVASRPVVTASIQSVADVLDEAASRYLIIAMPSSSAGVKTAAEENAQKTVEQTHGLVIETYSQQEFTDIQSRLAGQQSTAPVAQELSRIMQEEAPIWDGNTPLYSVISLVNLY